MSSLLDQVKAIVKKSSNFELYGTVTDVRGIIIEGSGPHVAIGTTVTIKSGLKDIQAQVVGFNRDRVLLMPFGELLGITPGATIVATESQSGVMVSPALLGRVIDGMGNPLDGKPLPVDGEMMPLYANPPSALSRTRISQAFDVGVKALNSMLTVGVGQRVAIMAGSGVGKSTLLGMIAKHSVSDINIIALVGERGREVREFIEKDLGPEGLARSVVVVATSDQSPLIRIRAAFLATAIAEYYRQQSQKVVLMVDSVTRLAMAQREVGLAIGEPPSTKGYTPSVFSMLPKLLERAGNNDKDGSITGLYTVLVEGDDMNEPIADTVRGILDGHVVLSRRLAGKGHYPAIEILESVSRVMNEIVPDEVVTMANAARDIIATYREAEDLITIGAYKRGQNLRVDRAVDCIDALNAFLKQKADQKVGLEESWIQLAKVFEAANLNKNKAAAATAQASA